MVLPPQTFVVKFIIDENITPELCSIFRAAALLAHHVNALKSHSKQQIKDDQIRHLSLFKGYIVVTKDDDFVKSFVSRKVPEKVVFLHGLDKKKDLLSCMQAHVASLPSLLKQHDFIEVNASGIRLPFSNLE